MAYLKRGPILPNFYTQHKVQVFFLHGSDHICIPVIILNYWQRDNNTHGNHWSQNKDWIEHDVVSALRCWSPLLCLAFGIPIWLPKKLYCLYSLLTIAARFFSLVLCIHNIPTIIIEKTSAWLNLHLLNWAYQYGRQWLHFRTTDARSSLYFEISGLIANCLLFNSHVCVYLQDVVIDVVV